MIKLLGLVTLVVGLGPSNTRVFTKVVLLSVAVVTCMLEIVHTMRNVYS